MNGFQSIAVIGGGIGGLTTAIALQRKGHSVTVYESAPSYRPLGAGIVLASNALKALEEIGILGEVSAVGHVLKRFVLKDSVGRDLSVTEAVKADGKYGRHGTLALHRADLHEVLRGLLRRETIVHGKACVSFRDEGERIHLHFSDGSSAVADAVIAADGIHSVFRKTLVPESVLRYSGYTAYRAVVEMPERFQADEASESWGLGKRFGVVPIGRGRVYWYVTVDAKASAPSMSIGNLRDVFRDFHPLVLDVLSNTRSEQLIHNDISDFIPVRRYAFGRMVLLGDAAHATTPNLGQGACMAIEDAAVLGNSFVQSTDPALAFRRFEERRLERNTAVVNKSYSMGRIAQLKNPLLARARNVAMRLTPARVTERQLKFLYDVSFK